MDSQGERGGGGVFVAGCSWERVELRWVAADELEIAFPTDVPIQDQKEHAFFFGRTIKVSYRAAVG